MYAHGHKSQRARRTARSDLHKDIKTEREKKGGNCQKNKKKLSKEQL